MSYSNRGRLQNLYEDKRPTPRYVVIPPKALVTTGYKMGAIRRLLKPLSCVAGESVSIVVVVLTLALL